MQGEGVGLIVKTHAFGDALLATPAAAALVRRGGRWRVLSGPSAAEVWRRMPGIAGVEVAPFPPRGSPGLLSLAFWTLRNRRRFRGIGECVVFHQSESVRRWVRLLTSAPSRSGGEKPLGPWESAKGFDARAFASSSYAEIAGVEIDDPRPVFGTEPGEEARASQLLGDRRRWIAMAPGGARNPRDIVRQKLWPAERFGEIARRSGSRGWGCVLLGDRFDAVPAAKVSEAAGGSVLDLCGRVGWGVSAAVLSRCDAFLGADSGAAHLATAQSTPSVVLFGPTDPEALYAPGHVIPVRTSAECAPCYSNEVFRGCARPDAPCMFDIDVDAVWAIMESLLNAHSGA
jgi:ADP-heptose:LPS heptosyltransferase